ncbi:hypothetical protein AGMMS49965_24310 [Bacteroidia bacterium]|nr:hypothetical protein AGMMS49965_24310 [Bacteroidia bacterium]
MTELGMITDVKPLQPEKVPRPIEVTEFPMVREDNVFVYLNGDQLTDALVVADSLRFLPKYTLVMGELVLPNIPSLKAVNEQSKVSVPSSKIKSAKLLQPEKASAPM